jgi:hypothetical protein
MFAKNEIPGSASALACRQELKYLYARRSAIDSLIESLEEYNRLRETARETASAGGVHVGCGHPSHVPAREGRGFWH